MMRNAVMSKRFFGAAIAPALSIQNGVIELMIKVKDQKLGQNTR